jgi:hypothetical protein
MSKGKYKRKREDTKQHAQQETKQVPVSDSVVVPAEEKEKTPATTKPKRNGKKESLMGLREMIERPSLTDSCIMFFTGVLAAAAIYQFIIMGGQLDVMRKDQRPWIKLTFDRLNVKGVGSPIGGFLRANNDGKTPAKQYAGKCAMEKVRIGDQPKLDYGNAVNFTGGTIFPNDPQARACNIQQTIYHPTGPADEAVILTKTDSEDYANGRIVFVAYGSVSYSDFFHVQHWTKYCAFFAMPEEVTVQNCTDYNDVDNN